MFASSSSSRFVSALSAVTVTGAWPDTALAWACWPRRGGVRSLLPMGLIRLGYGPCSRGGANNWCRYRLRPVWRRCACYSLQLRRCSCRARSCLRRQHLWFQHRRLLRSLLCWPRWPCIAVALRVWLHLRNRALSILNQNGLHIACSKSGDHRSLADSCTHFLP